MGANFMLLALLAMLLGWFVYFKIQDNKKDHSSKNN